MYDFDEIRNTDPEIADAIMAEMERQNSHIELIASENWVSKAVMAAMGSPLTNKYAEGYPGKRYMADASAWMRWKNSPEREQRNSLDVSMPMCSPTQERRRIWQ